MDIESLMKKLENIEKKIKMVKDQYKRTRKQKKRLSKLILVCEKNRHDNEKWIKVFLFYNLLIVKSLTYVAENSKKMINLEKQFHKEKND